jgi:NADPH2:quinone reductase
VHAAAGGVGSLAVQLGGHFEAGRVIATASSEEKRELVVELGADAATDSSPEDLAQRLIAAKRGSQGRRRVRDDRGAVFTESLRALAPFGRLVAYGSASGEPATISAGELMQGSQAVVGFWLVHCLANPTMVGISRAGAPPASWSSTRRPDRRRACRPGVPAGGVPVGGGGRAAVRIPSPS